MHWSNLNTLDLGLWESTFSIMLELWTYSSQGSIGLVIGLFLEVGQVQTWWLCGSSVIMVSHLHPERFVGRDFLWFVGVCLVRRKRPMLRKWVDLPVLMVVSTCRESFAWVIASGAPRNRLLCIGRFILLRLVRHDMGAFETSPFWIDALLDELVLLGTFFQFIFVFGIRRSDVEDFWFVFHQEFEVLDLLISLSVKDVIRRINHFENVSRVLGTDSAVFAMLLLLTSLTRLEVHRVCFIFFVRAETVQWFLVVFRLLRFRIFLFIGVFEILYLRLVLVQFLFSSQKFNLLKCLLASELGLDFFIMHPVESQGSSSIDYGGVVAILDLGVQKLFWQLFELPLDDDEVRDYLLLFLDWCRIAILRRMFGARNGFWKHAIFIIIFLADRWETVFVDFLHENTDVWNISYDAVCLLRIQL